MARNIDATFKEKLTSGSKNDMRSLANFAKVAKQRL